MQQYQTSSLTFPYFPFCENEIDWNYKCIATYHAYCGRSFNCSLARWLYTAVSKKTIIHLAMVNCHCSLNDNKQLIINHFNRNEILNLCVEIQQKDKRMRGERQKLCRDVRFRRKLHCFHPFLFVYVRSFEHKGEVSIMITIRLSERSIYIPIYADKRLPFTLKWPKS